jgi:ankyrin repeat protein
MTRLLLSRGADPNVRVSLRKRMIDSENDRMHEFRDVTPLSWGKRFHLRRWVNPLAMQLIAGISRPCMSAERTRTASG